MWDNAWMMVGPCTVTEVMDVEVDIEDIDDYIEDNDDNINDNDENIVAVEEDIDDGAEPPAPVLITTTKSPTMPPSVMVSTQISVDAVSVEVDDNINDNDDNLVGDSDDDSITDLAESPAPVLLTTTKSPTMPPSVMVSTQISVDAVSVEVDDNINDNDDNLVGDSDDDSITDLAESPAPVLLTTTKSPTMAPSVMVSTQISVDAVAVEVNDNINDNDDNINDNDDNLVGDSDDDSITDLAESPAPVLLTITKSPTMTPSVMVPTQISLDAVAVEVDDNIIDNDDNIDDNDDNLVDDSDDNSITDLVEPPAPVLPTTTKSPTMTPTVMVSTQSIEDTPPTLSPTMILPGDDDDALTPSPTLAASLLPPCPADYDITKTTYVGGDLVKLSGNVFECQVDLVKYCNIGLWDESLLTEDANAEEAWNNAWLFFSECAVEEEVSGDLDS
jgi:hypothetical protein